jgi:hypothetical protein
MTLQAQTVTGVLTQRLALIEQVERFLTGRDAWICPVFPTPISPSSLFIS